MYIYKTRQMSLMWSILVSKIPESSIQFGGIRTFWSIETFLVIRTFLNIDSL